MSALYDRLRADIVVAMKARDTVTLTALRTADALVQRASMELSKPIDDALVTSTIRKGVKNLADAKAEFLKGGRADLAAANEVEIALLGKYLPAGLDEARLDALIAAAIQSSGAVSRKEMGKVIAVLQQLPEAPLIDFGQASRRVQARLP